MYGQENLKTYYEEIAPEARTRLVDFYKHTYLHSSMAHYNAVNTSDFKPVDISALNIIMDEIVRLQEKREKEVYSLLGVKNAQELNYE